MAHDFIKFPELTNSQMQTLYMESPHKQITESFRGKVEKVTDGDTVRVSVNFRNFDFPVRLSDINTPELSEGGEESKEWLRNKIEGLEVQVVVDHNNRVGKYGRLIGRLISNGTDINIELIQLGLATTFKDRNKGMLPKLNKELKIEKWL